MSDYEFVHLLPERHECDSCGHSLWHMPDLPVIGPITKEQHEFNEKNRRFSGMLLEALLPMARDLNRAMFAPQWDKLTKDDGQPLGLSAFLPEGK